MFSILEKPLIWVPKSRNEIVLSPVDNSSRLIELQDVQKRFNTPAGAFFALKGINLSIGAGEFVAIVGKSGSGKSTMINMITGIDHPTAGEVLIKGVNIHHLSEDEISRWRGRTIGIVFQFFQLIPSLTLVENVLLPMDLGSSIQSKNRKERALQLLEIVGMASNAQKLPSEVSGGQQQRAAIARALANDPPILIADEPTGNLDSQTAASIFNLFDELARLGKTILMVTHDNDLASRAKRIIEIVDGEIKEGK